MSQMRHVRKKIKTALKQVPYAVDAVRGVRTQRENAAKLADSAYNAIALSFEGVPLPPIQMRDRVRKTAILAEDFIIEGQQAYDQIRRFSEANGLQMAPDDVIYEFGCGCGRIARYFASEPIGKFFGSDVDSEMIEWCQKNLASERFEFFANDYLPPLDLPSASVSFAYSISVFTHMTAESQAAWFRELARILRSGGHLLISFLERSDAELPSGVDALERIETEYRRSWLGKGDAPQVYYSTVNTLSYLQEELSGSFSFVAHEHRTVRGHQSLALFRRL